MMFRRSATKDWVKLNFDDNWLDQHQQKLMDASIEQPAKRKWVQVPLGASKKSCGNQYHLKDLPLEHNQGALPLCTSHSLLSALHLFGDVRTHDFIELGLEDIQTNVQFTERARHMNHTRTSCEAQVHKSSVCMFRRAHGVPPPEPDRADIR
jgi:hypothetical protein